MSQKLITHLPVLVSLYSFTVFPEYFITISLIYILVVTVLSNYNIYGLIIQQALSECIGMIFLMASCLLLNDELWIFSLTSFNSSVLNDYFAFFTRISICVFSMIFFLIIANFLKEQNLSSFEYLLISLFAVLGLIIMCISNDLLLTYLAIELSSLAFYVLASFRKTSSYSIESGIKYFIVGAISSAFFLLGSSFIYGLTGTINFSDFRDLFDLFNFYLDSENILYDKSTLIFILKVKESLFYFRFVEFGLTLVLFSLFIKLGLAPFHLWALDVFEGAPTNSTFFFATITKLSIFVLLVRLCYQSFFNLKNCWQFYSLWVGLFSIFIGSFGGLTQRKLKTLLAYSGTSHMGYALIAFSTSTFLGLQVLLFYMFIYMVSNLAIWYIVLLLRLKKKSFKKKYNKELSDLALLKKSNFILAVFLSITMFSIAGIPPLAGFLAKMNVLLSILGISFYLMSLLIVFCSVVSTFYYIRIIKVLYFESLLVGKLYYPIRTTKVLILSMLIVSLVYSFIYPTFLYLISYKAVLHLL